MAQHWAAKAPTEVVERRWPVPVRADDGLSSISVTASGVTKDADEVDGDDAVVTLSAGTANTTAVVTITATTSDGDTLIETFYLPIAETTVQIGDTVNDYISFALRKVFGAATAPSRAAADALERLEAMLLSWKAQGADVGSTFPLATTTVMNVPDEYVEGIRANLIVAVADRYGMELSPVVVEQARRGLQLIKAKNLSDDREGGSYF